MVTPEPSHHFRENRAAHALSVGVHPPRVVQVVALFGQRVFEAHVLEKPVAPRVVHAFPSRAAVVVAAVLQEDAQRLLLAFPDDVCVRVAAAIAEIDEAADNAQHLAEVVRTLPCDRKSRNRAGAGTANPMALGVPGDVVFLVKHRHQLVDDDPRVLVVERVVFGWPVGIAIAPVAGRRLRLCRRPSGIDEHGNHHRDLTPVDQVVENVWRAQHAIHVLERLPVLKNHQTRRNAPVVLRRHIDPVGVLRALVRLARKSERPTHFPLRHTLVRLRVGPDHVIDIHVGALRLLGRRRSLWLRLLRTRH